MPYADPEARHAYQVAYAKKNSARKKAASKVWYSAKGYELHLSKFLDFNRDDYEAMSVAQGHKCLICKNPETAKGSTGTVRRLCVDHDHSQENADGTVPRVAIRGLLCRSCNLGLAGFRDNPTYLDAAKQYLKGCVL